LPAPENGRLIIPPDIDALAGFDRLSALDAAAVRVRMSDIPSWSRL
jgi:hypothetical protein